MFWEQLRIAWYQMMNCMETIPIGWYILTFIVGVPLAKYWIKLVPNDRWRFGDKLK